MSPQLALYLAAVFGAVALYLLMPKPGRDLRVLGGVIGAGTLGLLWLVLMPLTLLDGGDGRPLLDTGFADGETLFYYVFSSIAVCAAVRVITHHRPVYAALWFVMVVISSAGLLLTLSAEFMAFAMLIIYGGAILVTYMFVIMLATPPRNDGDPDDGPEYERFAQEPLWASAAGFLLLAVLLGVMFEPMTPGSGAQARADAVVIETVLADRNGGVEATNLGTPTGREADGGGAELTNVEQIGLDLFLGHPLAIELAGVILLLALIGAVVIAKTQIYEEPAGPVPGAGATAGPSRRHLPRNS
ncbi:MAG: NADH-quinone oxidoreductase subunit J, partial [Planctomycetota bacterium]